MVNNRSSKKKGKKKKSGSRSANYAYATPTNITSSVGSIRSGSLHHQVAGLCDPWSPQARGSKVPDTDSTKSVPITITWPRTYDTLVTGTKVCLIQPSLESTLRTNQTNVGQTVAGGQWNGAEDSPDFTALDAAFDKYRIVSWGVRVYSTLAPTDQAGSFKLITLPETPDYTASFSYGGSLFEDTVSLPLSDKDIHWISKRDPP